MAHVIMQCEDRLADKTQGTARVDDMECPLQGSSDQPVQTIDCLEHARKAG